MVVVIMEPAVTCSSAFISTMQQDCRTTAPTRHSRMGLMMGLEHSLKVGLVGLSSTEAGVRLAANAHSRDCRSIMPSCMQPCRALALSDWQ